MHRRDLQKIALAKFEDARLLFENQRYSNSYYLYGYAIEISLKSRLTVYFLPEALPDKKLVNDIYTHDLIKLLSLSGLKGELEKAKDESISFNANWSTVSDWSENSRYDMVDVFKATAMHEAMSDQENGVFQWLQKHW